MEITCSITRLEIHSSIDGDHMPKKDFLRFLQIELEQTDTRARQALQLPLRLFDFNADSSVLIWSRRERQDHSSLFSLSFFFSSYWRRKKKM